jgi:hypothetical protein
MVYFRPQYAKTRRFKKDGLSMDEIRGKYGASNIKTKNPYYLTARA